MAHTIINPINYTFFPLEGLINSNYLHPMETIGVIAGVLSVIIAWLAYKKQFLSKPKEELEHLKVQFKATQTLSLNVQQKIQELVDGYGYGSKDLYPNMTFGNYLKTAKESFNYNLSDTLYNQITKLELSRSNIASMVKSLETQFESLLQIDTQLGIILKELKS